MDKPFYEDGLAFECQRCSACCRFDPGYVFLSENDIIKLVRHLKISREVFLEKFCKTVDIGGFKRISIIEKSNNDCWFWDDNGCKVYEARPLQCRSYPFWFSLLADKSNWDGEEQHCPGVNKGRKHSKEEIESWLAWRRREPYSQTE
ncbi:MAG: YkgJ family cysteine cluster protein [Spirochaetales bacterium]|nr:YkgJ family cysteine cluster protein [Spirochaetales bacterium]